MPERDYKKRIIEWSINHPGGLWADNKGAAAARKWLQQNAPDDFKSLYYNESDKIRRGIDKRFLPKGVVEKEVENAVRDGVSSAGKKIFDIIDTASGFVPGVVGTANWLGHLGADLANGNADKVGRDIALAGALGFLGKGAGRVASKYSGRSSLLRKAADFIDDLTWDMDRAADESRAYSNELDRVQNLNHRVDAALSNINLDGADISNLWPDYDGLREHLLSEGVTPERLTDDNILALTYGRSKALLDSVNEAPGRFAIRNGADPEDGFREYLMMQPGYTKVHPRYPQGTIGYIDTLPLPAETGVDGTGIVYVSNIARNHQNPASGVMEMAYNSVIGDKGSVVSGFQLMEPDKTTHIWKKYRGTELLPGIDGMWTPEGVEPITGTPVVRLKKPTYNVPIKNMDVFSVESISPDGNFTIDWNGDALHSDGGFLHNFDGGGKFIRAPKYNNGTARFMELLNDYASMLYNPYEPSVPEVRTPIRYEPQPHYGLYEYPASTGMAEGYPITVPGMVAASTVTRPEKAVEDLFSEEAMARRALKQRYAESNFDNKAKSHAGAIGAWQIMPITYKDYLGRGRGKAGDLNDPEYNRKVRDWVMGVIQRDLRDLYSENDAPRVKLAKIYGAYNWGTGNMRKYLRKQRDAGVDISNDTSWVEGLNPETKRYIKYLALDEDIPDSTYTNRAFEEAAAKRGYMKDGGPLNLLYGGGDKFELGNLTGGLYPLESNAVAEDTVVPYTEEGMREKRFYDDPSNKKTHRVSAGETAWGISQQSGVPLQTLLKMNPDIGDGSLIKPGQELMLGYKPYPANREKDGDKVSASMLTYKVQKGDYLGKIAKDNGLTLEQLLKINPQFTGRENAIAIGETVNLGEAKQKREFKTMRERREWERGLDDVSAIQNYKHEKNYAIVDKERQTMTVYSPDNKIVRVIHVNTGSSNDDFNTRTYSSDKGHILYGQGNMSTPAGITEIVSIGKDYGHKSYVRARVGSDGKVSTVKDENGNTVADTIASSMHYEKGLFGPNSSNGCIRMSGEDADSLSDILGVGSRVYTLPQRKDENGDSLSRFKLEDGKLSFYSDDPVGRTDNNGLEPIPVYEKGRPKKDKNGNIIYRDFASEDDYNLTRDMTAAPLFSNYSGDSEAETELERNRAAFANTLADEKQSIMSDLIANKIGLNSDTYNRLAELSVALAAQESEFGTGKKFKVKAAFPGAVRALKGENGAQSVGATQMKYAGYNDEVRKIMRRMRINTSIDTDNQKDIENSARATMVLLAYMYNNQLTPSHRRKLKEAGMSEEEALAMMFNGRSVKELEELVSDKNWREKLITVSKYPGGIGRNLPFNLGTKEVLAADYANKVNKYLQENESFHYSFGGLLDKLSSVYSNDRARMLDAIRKIRQK